MKTLLSCAIALALCGSYARVQGANSMVLSGSYIDKMAYDAERNPIISSTASARLNATVPILGTDSSQFNADTLMDVIVGGSSMLGGPARLGDLGYTQGRSFSATSEDKRTQISASWTSASLTFSVIKQDDVLGLNANFNGDEGKFGNQEVQVTIHLGNFSLTRAAFVSGSATSTIKTTEWGEMFFLKYIQLKGSADLTPPKVTVTSPSANKRTTANPVAIIGKVSDNVGTSELLFHISTTRALSGEEEFGSLQMTENNNDWALDIEPTPGTNYYFLKAVDTSGNTSAMLTNSFFYVHVSELSLDATEGGVITGQANGALLEVGRGYKVTAKPSPGYILEKWTDQEDNVISYEPTCSFQMTENLTLRANFVENPFSAFKGTYAGLFYDHNNGLSSDNAGMLTLTMTEKGTFSGKITMLSGAYPFSGHFYLNGESDDSAVADLVIKRSKLPTLEARLALSLTAGQLSGEVKQWISNTNDPQNPRSISAQIEARANRVTAANPDKGFYTFSLPGTADYAAFGPLGGSYGTVTCDSRGGAKLALNLADQAASVNVSSTQTQDGTIPFFSPLYGNKGLVMGWLRVADGQVGDDGNILWQKLASGSRLYPEGFTQYLGVEGSLYVAPRAGTNLVSWVTGLMTLSDGAAVSLSANVIFANGRFAVPAEENSDQIKITVIPSTGAVSGSFVPTGSKKAVPFKGILVATTGSVSGFFIGSSGTGLVRMVGAEIAAEP